VLLTEQKRKSWVEGVSPISPVCYLSWRTKPSVGFSWKSV